MPDVTDRDIKITKDYSIFRRVKGNRDLYPNHVKRLVEGFKEKVKEKKDVLAYNPVLVNERMQVIDGQHRIETAKKLGLPVYYIIKKGLDLKDIQALNSGTKPWGMLDYAKSYAELGRVNYQVYMDYYKDYPMFDHKTLRYVLSNGKTGSYSFICGNFQVKGTLRADNFFATVLELKEYYKRATDTAFALAFWEIYNNKNYEHEVMLHQLNRHPEKINEHVKKLDYLRELEDIYSMGASAENKVRLYK